MTAATYADHPCEHATEHDEYLIISRWEMALRDYQRKLKELIDAWS
jgi:hypothetical protein